MDTTTIAITKGVRRGYVAFLAILFFFLGMDEAFARLPKPIVAQGIILAVDQETKTLIVKLARDRKPLLFDWNSETTFIYNGKRSSPSSLTEGHNARITFKRLSFRNPLLKEVSWESGLQTKDLHEQ